MPNFSIALTGLQADTVALNTIGNNLANLNTTAFKSETTSFEDLFYQNIGSSGSSDPLQIGTGTRVAGTTSNFAQGGTTTTQNSTDMELEGNGFFVVQQGTTQALTRAGNFQLDTQGNLITTNGESVMGYGTTNGVVNSSGSLTPLQIPINATQPAQPTGNISLNSTSPQGAVFASPVTVYDSLGESHVATVTYTKQAPVAGPPALTQWSYAVALPAGDETGTPVNNTGTVSFNSAGVLVSPTTNPVMTFPGLADGASSLSINFNLLGASGTPTVSETAAASTTSTSSQDGYASGTYQSFTVGNSGVLTATFSNGNTETVGQVAVATVANVDGLANIGGNDFKATAASGLMQIGQAGVGARGTIEDDALEASNVDISQEFSNLIIAQRAFEANSKTVTTFDSVSETSINMIR
jgi:flagellar hook protein FlgE